jgi:hypothetical protein
MWYQRQGNIQGQNLLTTGIISATANVVGGNIRTTGSISATGNITAGNLITATTVIDGGVSTSGNVTGANILHRWNYIIHWQHQRCQHCGQLGHHQLHTQHPGQHTGWKFIDVRRDFNHRQCRVWQHFHSRSQPFSQATWMLAT